MLVGFWFCVIAAFWAGFFLLEGFDFGVGMIAPVLRTGDERSTALRAIGSVWDGNEVGLLVAGGATVAAFPKWSASVFNGSHLLFALLIAGLVVRGIGVEGRGRMATARARRCCEACVGVGSMLPAVALGVLFGNLMEGVRLNRRHEMVGGLADLISPYALVAGASTLALFLLHGALFLAFRTGGGTAARARALSRPLSWLVGGLVTAFLLWGTAIRGSLVSELLAVLMIVAVVAAVSFAHSARHGLGFVGTSIAALLVPVWVFASLWPEVLPASNGAGFSLTMYAASASSAALDVMTVVTLVVTPLVLAYQAWTYWVFRARVGVPSRPSGKSTAADRARTAAARAGARS